MRIFITTGIYPPEVGGPAQYAKELEEALRHKNYHVEVLPFAWFRKFPSVVRHVLYFLRLLFILPTIDAVIALDTFSVGAPSVAAGLLLRVPVVIRTGGDFLWEEHIERTKESILLSEFYKEERNYSIRESIIFLVSRWTLRHATHTVFSTNYQRDIFIDAYELDEKKTSIIENFYGEHTPTPTPTEKRFVCFVRGDRHWKNIDVLKKAFEKARKQDPTLILDVDIEIPREDVLRRLGESYAAILVSLGDISPNFILEALSFEKPFILTTETGLRDRLEAVGLFANPKDVNAIAEQIVWLRDDANYQAQKDKLAQFSFVHTYDDIAEEFVAIIQRISSNTDTEKNTDTGKV